MLLLVLVVTAVVDVIEGQVMCLIFDSRSLFLILNLLLFPLNDAS